MPKVTVVANYIPNYTFHFHSPSLLLSMNCKISVLYLEVIQVKEKEERLPAGKMGQSDTSQLSMGL